MKEQQKQTFLSSGLNVAERISVNDKRVDGIRWFLNGKNICDNIERSHARNALRWMLIKFISGILHTVAINILHSGWYFQDFNKIHTSITVPAYIKYIKNLYKVTFSSELYKLLDYELVFKWFVDWVTKLTI